MTQITKCNIPSGAKDIVIFVHGFGVRWDSRGMFTDLAKSLPQNWGSILFDFYNIDGQDVYISTVDEQITRLQEIIQNTQTKNPDANLHTVAHSMGCIITAMAHPTIKGRVILLSPPETFGTEMETYFRRYPGATYNDNEVIIPRKDGTTTHISLDFFEKTAKIQAEQEILSYSQTHKINLLQTTADEVIGGTSYALLQNQPNVKITQMPADHNFTDQNRPKLLNYIKQQLIF